jgi:predicted dinucleotide-binding enzyme
MRIGIVGTGQMGRTLGVRWAEAGHQVLFGSRHPPKAESVAARAGGGARGGDSAAAADFGEVVLYTVRDVLPSALLRDSRTLAGKIVIDCNNRDLGDDRHPERFGFDAPPRRPSLAETLARDIPGAAVVKAFNTLPSPVLALPRDTLLPHRVSVFLCSDDAAAKHTVQRLAEDLGLVGVDSGGLDRSWLIEAAADLLRLQIGPMGLGGYATLSVHVLPAAR